MLTDATLRRELIALGDQVPPDDLLEVKAQVAQRVERHARRARRRRCLACLVVVAAAVTSYGSIAIDRPGAGEEISPAEAPPPPTDGPEVTRPSSPARDLPAAPFAPTGPAQPGHGGRGGRESGAPRAATPAGGIRRTRGASSPPDAPRGPMARPDFRAEKQVYGTPLLSVKGVSSGCTYEDDTCAVFDVTESDRSVIVEVADSSGADVLFVVSQWVGPPGAPGAEVVESGRFCGGRSSEIVLAQDAAAIVVSVGSEGCGGGPGPKGGSISATFISQNA